MGLAFHGEGSKWFCVHFVFHAFVCFFADEDLILRAIFLYALGGIYAVAERGKLETLFGADPA